MAVLIGTSVQIGVNPTYVHASVPIAVLSILTNILALPGQIWLIKIGKSFSFSHRYVRKRFAMQLQTRHFMSRQRAIKCTFYCTYPDAHVSRALCSGMASPFNTTRRSKPLAFCLPFGVKGPTPRRDRPMRKSSSSSSSLVKIVRPPAPPSVHIFSIHVFAVYPRQTFLPGRMIGSRV